VAPADTGRKIEKPKERRRDRSEAVQEPFANLGLPALKRPSQIQGDTQRRQPRSNQENRLRQALLIGVGVAGGILVLAILAGILLTVRTKHGDVLIELNDPKANVVVKVDGDKIELSGLDRPLSLTAGEHGLIVTGADFETVAQSFTVKEGEKQVVKVTLKPKSGSVDGTPRDRTKPEISRAPAPPGSAGPVRRQEPVGELRCIQKHTRGVWSVALSPDGRFALSGSGNYPKGSERPDDFTMRLWEVDTGKELYCFTGHTDTVKSVAFSNDGLRVLSGSWDKTVRLWDIATKQELRRFDGHEGLVSGVAFSPDDRRVLSSATDGTIRLWDIATGKEVRRFTGHQHQVWCVAFSPDGQRVVSGGGGKDSSMRLWDFDNGNELQRLNGHTNGVHSVAFSPDGRQILSGGSEGTAILWDSTNGQELRRFSGHSVCFLRDGSLALTGRNDGTLRLWDTTTWAQIALLRGHSDVVQGVALFTDGRRALSGSWDSTVRLWRFPDYQTKKGEESPTADNQSPSGGGSLSPALQPGSLAGRQGPLREQLLREGGGNEETETAVDRGLGWILRQQQADGIWTLDGYDPGHGTGPAGPNIPAATALALLPLLGAGHTHQAGAHAPQVDRGLNYLLRTQPADGGFSGSAYQHCIPTIALCEAYGLTKDPRLKDPAQRGLDFIVQAQHAAGGWRYEPRQPGDSSCTGWALIALKTGQLAGLQVPGDTLQRVTHFLDDMEYADRSGYGYVDRTKGGPGTSAVGLLCRLHLGWEPADPRMKKGVQSLAANPPAPLHNMYYCYYASQVMRHVGGDTWRAWNSQMRSWLLAGQEAAGTRQEGSWSPVGDAFGKQGGRLMVTSLALLILEVYYRHVPFCLADGLVTERDVKRLPDAKPAVAKTPPDDRWASLFNGRDLTGWRVTLPGKNRWRVQNGTLIGGFDAGNLFSERDDYHNFHFLVEAKINANGNSGQWFRAQRIGTFPPRTYEAQIEGAGQDQKRTGSLFRLVGPGEVQCVASYDEVLVPPDTWFTQEVIADGNHIMIKVNGKVTADFTDRQSPYLEGHLGFHGGSGGTEIQLRKIEVKELVLRKQPEETSRTPQPNSQAPRDKPYLVTLNELPFDQHKSGPWPSADGLTLYWSSKRGRDFRIWVATRKNKEARFENIKELFAGYDLTVTADELEMILVGSNGRGLYTSSRGSTKDDWSRPRYLSEFDRYGFMTAPCFRPDGMILYAEQLGDKALAHNVLFRRVNRQASWSKPEAMTFVGVPEQNMRFPFVTADGRFLMGNVGAISGGMSLFSSNTADNTYGAPVRYADPVRIEVPGSVPGIFPRYVPATHELFFNEWADNQGRNDICIIKNFDPAAIKAAK